MKQTHCQRTGLCVYEEGKEIVESLKLGSILNAGLKTCMLDVGLGDV